MTDRLDSKIQLISMNGGGGQGCTIRCGNGVPAYPGKMGDIYLRLDGGAGSTLYVKETDTSSTTWAAK